MKALQMLSRYCVRDEGEISHKLWERTCTRYKHLAAIMAHRRTDKDQVHKKLRPGYLQPIILCPQPRQLLFVELRRLRFGCRCGACHRLRIQAAFDYDKEISMQRKGMSSEDPTFRLQATDHLALDAVLNEADKGA